MQRTRSGDVKIDVTVVDNAGLAVHIFATGSNVPKLQKAKSCFVAFFHAAFRASLSKSDSGDILWAWTSCIVIPYARASAVPSIVREVVL